MSENVVYLHPQPEPVAHYLRLGTFHRQVEKLLAAGRLLVERVVVELQWTNERLARLGPVLRDLHATVGDGPHAHAPARRDNRAAGARAARR